MCLELPVGKRENKALELLAARLLAADVCSFSLNVFLSVAFSHPKENLPEMPVIVINTAHPTQATAPRS